MSVLIVSCAFFFLKSAHLCTTEQLKDVSSTVGEHADSSLLKLLENMQTQACSNCWRTCRLKLAQTVKHICEMPQVLTSLCKENLIHFYVSLCST